MESTSYIFISYDQRSILRKNNGLSAAASGITSIWMKQKLRIGHKNPGLFEFVGVQLIRGSGQDKVFASDVLPQESIKNAENISLEYYIFSSLTSLSLQDTIRSIYFDFLHISNNCIQYDPVKYFTNLWLNSISLFLIIQE